MQLVPLRRMRLNIPDKISQTLDGGLILKWKETSGTKTIYTELELRTLYEVNAIRVETQEKERKMTSWKLRAIE